MTYNAKQQTRINDFVGNTIVEMIKEGVKVTLSPDYFVTGADNVECSGWFDHEEKEFVVAMGKEEWLEVYAHEYCHFTQMMDGYIQQFDDDTHWDWLEGVDVPMKEVTKSIRGAQKLEADNERRTVEIIKKYNLPINLDRYIQKCNAYIMFYDVVLRTRKWSNGNTPAYCIPEVLDKMEKSRILHDSELRSAPNWFFDIVSKRCMK